MSIETIDNPGWHIEVDLTETHWAAHGIAFAREERSESDWIQSEVRSGKFIGSGGVGNLEELIYRFLALVQR